MILIITLINLVKYYNDIFMINLKYLRTLIYIINLESIEKSKVNMKNKR